MPTAKPKDSQPEPDEFEFAEGWKPEVGAVIKGVVEDLDLAYSEYGNYPVITIQTDAGSVAVHAFHQTLRGKLEELQPVKGDVIGIKYYGEVKPEGAKRSYHKYRVKSDTANKGGFWDKVAPAQEQLPPAEEADEDLPF